MKKSQGIFPKTKEKCLVAEMHLTVAPMGIKYHWKTLSGVCREQLATSFWNV